MPLGIDFLQIFLHLFNVVLLFGGLYILLYSPIRDFVHKREEHYAKIHREAEDHMKKAENLKEEYEHKLNDVEDELAHEREKIVTEMELYRADRMKEVEDEAKEILLHAEEEGNRRRLLIINDAKDDISKLIQEATDKVLIGESTQDIYDAFLDEAERGEKRG